MHTGVTLRSRGDLEGGRLFIVDLPNPPDEDHLGVLIWVFNTVMRFYTAAAQTLMGLGVHRDLLLSCRRSYKAQQDGGDCGRRWAHVWASG